MPMVPPEEKKHTWRACRALSLTQKRWTACALAMSLISDDSMRLRLRLIRPTSPNGLGDRACLHRFFAANRAPATPRVVHSTARPTRPERTEPRRAGGQSWGRMAAAKSKELDPKSGGLWCQERLSDLIIGPY